MNQKQFQNDKSMTNPSMTIANWPVKKLVPYGRHLRKNDQAVARMVSSIREFGFKLGMDTLAVIVCDEWSESQVKAFRLMVNRSASWAEWDEELVALEIEDLKAWGFDLNLTGFDPGELDQLLFGEATTEAEDAAETTEGDTTTRPGDLWTCGSHRVLCGDATSSEPLELMRRPMLNHSARGDGIYDPFLGSGTSLIAAESIERVCYGLEIDPGYVDRIVRRWEKLSGKAAVLETDGRTFEQVKEARSAAVERV